MGTLHEQLSEQFYQWELRGRGWRVFDEPVFPEPPFVAFPGHFLPDNPVVDDGRRPTFLSSFVRKLGQKVSPTKVETGFSPEPEEEPQPKELTREDAMELQTSLPAKLDISREAFDQFLSNLSLCREPIAFEVLGVQGRVLTQFAASKGDVSQVRRQLQAHFPEAVFLQRAGTLDEAWDSCEGDEILAVEFGLEREFMFPLASGKIDPFIGIVGALAELQPGELGLFQVLFQPTQHPWADSIMRSVTHADGKPFFVNSPELTAGAERKVIRPLYAAVVRIMARTATRSRLVEIARDLAGSLRVFAHPQGNALIPLHNEDYPFAEHIEDVLLRQSRRTGMLLNIDELFGFVHLPSSAVRSSVLLRDTGKTKAAPSTARQAQGVLIGENVHAGETVPVRLTADQRVRHTHIIGASGTGKSTLLFNLIQQDIQNGDGVAVLDPHGDLIERILGVIPQNRIDDVVLVDLSDENYPVGFNILSAHSNLEKTLLASDLVSVFRRLSSTWGDQMDTVLQNSILAFLESRRGGTLADLRRFLNEPPYRAEFLKTVQDPEVLYYWQKVFPQLAGGKSIGPVLTRLQNFFSQKSLRNMVSQPENKLDFANIMDTGKIFLAKLPEGMCGAENTYLLGTLLMSKFQQIAMSRQAQQMSARRDFWLYLDEFDHFITPSMAEILKGARKYRLGLTLAHQELHQLQSDPKVASAVATHPCTRIVFRVGDDDARKLSEGFAFFDAQSLKNLEKFQAIARVERSDFDFNLTVPLPEEPDASEAASRRQAIITRSREQYGTARADVEATLAKLREPVTQAKPSASTTPPTSAANPPIVTPSVVVEPPKPAAVPQPTDSEKKEDATTPTEPKPTVSVSVAQKPRDRGIGGNQHNLIRERIEAVARQLGYSTSREHRLEHDEKVDVVLEKSARAIACEIGISTTIDHEVGNATKCLEAGFKHVALISVSTDRLTKTRQAIDGCMLTEAAARVGYYTPEQFIAHLKDLAAVDAAVLPVKKPSETTHGKYKVKTKHPSLTAEERKAKEDMVYRAIAEVMRQPKGV